MLLAADFEIVHNRQDALHQEYRLAREELDATRHLPLFAPGSVARYQAARERLNRARELLLFG